jgi:uncharacterized protein (TIGR03083 family)
MALSKSDIVRCVKAERRATVELLRSLEPPRFDDPTALPGWRVREIVAHLITVDKATVTGTNLVVVFTSMQRLERWNEGQVPRWAERPVPELLDGLDRWGRRFARFVGALPAAMYRMRLPNPWGRVAGMMVWVRAYDEWIHRQDIRRALGMGDEQAGAAPIAEFLLACMATVTLRAIGSRPGRVAVALEDGGTPITEWAFDLASGSAGPGSVADARVVCPASAFIMATAGRDIFSDLESAGTLSIEGDRAVADAFLAKLRIV